MLAVARAPFVAFVPFCTFASLWLTPACDADPSPVDGDADASATTRDGDTSVTSGDGADAGPVDPGDPTGRRCEGPLVDGQRNGAWTCWHDNGVLEAHLTYARGQLDGPSETFDRDGLPVAKGNYEDGLAQGAWDVWQEIGYFDTLSLRTKRSGHYVDSRPVGTWTGVWVVDGDPREGELSYVDGQREGPFRQWWPSGPQAVEGAFFQGSQHGRWKNWFDSDPPVVSLDAGFFYGQYDGAFADYYEDGKPKTIGEYRVGTRIGTWHHYDADGVETIETCDDWGHCQ